MQAIITVAGQNKKCFYPNFSLLVYLILFSWVCVYTIAGMASENNDQNNIVHYEKN